MGKCSEFLNSGPQKRLKKALEHGICETCFMYKCFRKQKNGKCLYKPKIPVLVICQACNTENGIDRNVLLSIKMILHHLVQHSLNS